MHLEGMLYYGIMHTGLDIGFALDRRWHTLRGDMKTSKESDLLALAKILQDEKVNYTVIGGIALQVHRSEPRTTLDIDIAVPSYDSIPAQALRQAGFKMTGQFEHSQNWQGPDGTPIQFTDEGSLSTAWQRCTYIDLGESKLAVLSLNDLLHAKLRAAHDITRRRSKRLQDIADIVALIEEHPELESTLSDQDKVLIG